MPVTSQAQRRFMYAVEEGKVPGVKKSVGEDFINASHGLKGLPEHAKGKHEATSHGSPFGATKGRAGAVAHPGHKGVYKPKHDHGPYQTAQLNAGGYQGQGNTAYKGFRISNP